MIDWTDTAETSGKPEKKAKQRSPEKKISKAIAKIGDAHYQSDREEAYQKAFPIIQDHIAHVTYEHLTSLAKAHTGEEEDHSALFNLMICKVSENAEDIHQDNHEMLRLFAKQGKRYSIVTLLEATDWPQEALDNALTSAADNEMSGTTKNILETQKYFDIALLAKIYDKSGESSIYKPIREHTVKLIAEMADNDQDTYRAKRQNSANRYMTEMFEEVEGKMREEWQMASSYEIGHKSEVFGQSITSVFNFKSNKVHVACTTSSYADFKTYDFKDYDNQNEIEEAYKKMQLIGPEKIPEYQPATAGKTRLNLNLKKR